MALGVTAPDERSDRDSRALWLLLGLIVLATVLRFWRLGAWNFEATEIFTLRDSLELRPSNARPLSYLLNYYLVRPFIPLDEFGLRLLPAVFGVLTIPVFFVVSRRLLGVRAALFGTLLLTVSELHIYYSQFARYWSLVILLCCIYPFAIYVGVRRRNLSALIVGLLAGVLAVLAHPVSVLLVGGPILWLGVISLRPRTIRHMWEHRAFRWGTLLAAVLVVIAVVRLVPVLQDWISMHDKNPGFGQFINRPKPNGVKQVLYIAAFVESLTLPLMLTAAAGIYLLWQRPDRTLAIYLTSLALFPIAFLTLISARTAVSQFYLVPTLPMFFMASGVFLERLWEVDWRVRPRWLVPVILTLLVISSTGPSLISHYRNGRRFDFRQVARWLDSRLGPNDIVFSDQPMVLAHYIPRDLVERLRTDEPFEKVLHSLGLTASHQVLWIVAPAPGHTFRPDLKQGGLAQWMWRNCQLRNTVGVGRIDFRQQYLQVYRCPPQPPGEVH
jgi:hypothetical protein